jgi:hypothetical protein
MQWNALPYSGGILDQDPEMLDMFMYIFSEQQKQEEIDRKKKEAEAKRKSPTARRGRRR